jgi:lipopolysaccharide transport system ATP-binding protein
MKENNLIIEFHDVWKKYSLREAFHRSLREDMVNLFKRNNRDLRKDEFWALKGINLSIRKGECIGLYGPNGAGKSTLMKLIASVTYPTKGEIIVRGKVAPLIEVGAGFHMDLTGRENIFINGAILGMRIKEIQEKLPDIIDFSELKEFIDMPVKKYSSGMYLRLGFSIAVHSSADILLIDEILAVGDENFQSKCIEKIKELNRMGKTIIIVSHNLKLMESLTKKIIYIKSGTLIQ